ncbi:DUF6894 family protein [Alsobacter sp. SYSU BS001988]
MPLFFFHVRDGESLLRDECGAEFRNLREAVDEAIRAARESVAEKARMGVDTSSLRYEVCGEGSMFAFPFPAPARDSGSREPPKPTHANVFLQVGRWLLRHSLGTAVCR